MSNQVTSTISEAFILVRYVMEVRLIDDKDGRKRLAISYSIKGYHDSERVREMKAREISYWALSSSNREYHLVFLET